MRAPTPYARGAFRVAFQPLNLERAAAAAGAHDVRVVEHEAALFEAVVEVDDGALADGVYKLLYTGSTNPSDDVWTAACIAAGASYTANAWWAHVTLESLGAIPCTGQIANLTDSVLTDLENGHISIRTWVDVFNLLFNACFAAGTPLLTPDGEKPIEAFRPGDWVLARPENTPAGTVMPRRVEAVFHTEAPLVNLIASGRTIRTTANHPFWVDGRGWTAARDLIEGDRLLSHDGRSAVVGGVEGTGETAKVYNFSVAEDHTYFVGAREWGFSVWAHNRCMVEGDDPPWWRTGNSQGPRWDNLRPGQEYPDVDPPTAVPGMGPSVWGEPRPRPGNPQYWWPFNGELPPGINLLPEPVADAPPHYILEPVEPMPLEQFEDLLESLGPFGPPVKK